MDDDEDEEEATESYCSSDPPSPGFGMDDPERTPASTSAPVEQKVKMNRVLAWRSSFDSVLAGDEAGGFRLCLYHTLGILALPLSCRSPHPHVQYFWFRVNSHVSDLPTGLARATTLVLFFSHAVFFPAVLMSLKRKYSHEPDDGANEEVQSHQGSDAVSPSPDDFPSQSVIHLFHAPLGIKPVPRTLTNAAMIPNPFSSLAHDRV